MKVSLVCDKVVKHLLCCHRMSNNSHILSTCVFLYKLHESGVIVLSTLQCEGVKPILNISWWIPLRMTATVLVASCICQPNIIAFSCKYKCLRVLFIDNIWVTWTSETMKQHYRRSSTRNSKHLVDVAILSFNRVVLKLESIFENNLFKRKKCIGMWSAADQLMLSYKDTCQPKDIESY